MEYTKTQFTTATTLVCPACDKQSVVETWIDDKFEYGVGKDANTLIAHVPLCHCRNCGLEYTDDRAERIRHATVCKHLQLLQPDEIVAIRERHGFTQQAFSEISRIGRASLARWESGAIFQNGSSDSLLYLLGFQENLKLLRQRHAASETALNPVGLKKRRFPALSEELAVQYRRESTTFQLHLND